MGISGNISTVGLPDVLQLLASGAKTGTLLVNKNEESTAIYFQEGNIVYAKSTSRRHAILDILVRENMLDLQKAEKIREKAKHKRKSPERILQETGEIEKSRLLEASIIHSKEVVYDLFHWLEGDFEFHEGELPPDDFADLTVSLGAYNLIMEGARRIDEWSRIRKAVPSMDMVFRLEGEPDASKIQFSKDEWQLLALIDGFRSVRSIAQTAGKSEFEVCRTLYGLKTAGLLKPVAGSNGPAPPPAVSEKKRLYAILAGSGLIIVILIIVILFLVNRPVSPPPMTESGFTPVAQATAPSPSPRPADVETALSPAQAEATPLPVTDVPQVASTIVPPAESPPTEPPPTEPPQQQPPAADGRIDLNTATSEQLQTLPRVGPATAAKIIEYRSIHGRFNRPEDLMNVSGIGPKTFERMRSMVMCSDTEPPQTDIPTAASSGEEDPVDAGPAATVNINSASEEELTQLPGVGPAKAALIVEYRETNGPFTSADQLMNIKGIGPKTFERMRPMVTLK